MKTISGSMLRWLRAAVLAALASIGVPVAADVALPNGEYRDQVLDMRVKVLGGYVAVARSWQADNINKGEFRWYLNPEWVDLKFELDSLDGSIKTIVRADSKFARSGNDIYVYDKVYFVVRLSDASGATTGWRWYDRRGNWIRYGGEGKIQSYGSRNDVAVNFERNGPNGAISAVKDHHGALALSLQYSADGKRVESVTDRAQRQVRYVYTGDLLTEVVDVRGYRWGYGYSNGLLVSKTDPEQRTTTIGYAGNRVVRITDPMNHVTTWDYNFDRGKRQYTVVSNTAQGKRTERRYDAEGRLLRELRGSREVYSLKRDGGNVRNEVDERGLITRVEYDANRNPIKRTYPDGTVTTSKYDGKYGLPLETVDELGVKRTFQYDAKGNLLTKTEAVGTPVERVTTSTYDAFGQRETMTVRGADPADSSTQHWAYDDYGNVASIIDGENQKYEGTHDVAGNLLTETNPRGKVWTNTFDAGGNLLTETTPLGHVRTYQYDKVGSRTRTIDEANNETTFTYDGENRRKTIVDPTGATRTNTYDKDGRRTAVTDANGVTTTFAFDVDGRRESGRDAAGNTTSFVYGAPGSATAGLMVRVVYPTFCIDYQYDQRDRVTRSTRRLPCEETPTQRVEVETTGYDAKGRKISETDALGRATLYEHDALDRVVRITDALGGKTEFTYDTRNNRTSVKDANGRATRFLVDKVNRVVAEIRPLGGRTAFAYDAAGNLVSRTSASGRRSVFEYDDADRRIAQRHYMPGSNAASEATTFVYDERDLLESYRQAGAVESSTQFHYDDAGRLLGEAVTYGAGGSAFTRSIGTTYWPNGLKKSFTYPDQTAVGYTYTGINWLESADTPGGQIRWSDYQWFAAKRIAVPGAVQTLDFDPLMRPRRLISRAIGSGTVEAPNGATITNESYDFDVAGSLSARTTTDGEYDYASDALGRLTQAVPPAALQPGGGAGAALPVERYQYDAVLHRRSSEHEPGAWDYDADGRLLARGQGVDRYRYEYDADGNTVRVVRGADQSPSEVVEYDYDAEQRLVEVRRDSVIVGRYGYDPFGRRIRKETVHGVTWFQYADEGLVAEFSGTGAASRLYGWEPGSEAGTAPLWLADKVGGAWRPYYFHLDQAGAPLRLTGTDGAVVWSALATAFGATFVATGTTVDNPLRFQGQYFDAESGLHYNRFRYYSPETGRYLTVDPLGIDGGLSVYAYASADPLTKVDPQGLDSLRARCIANPQACGDLLVAPKPPPAPPIPKPPSPGPRVPAPPLPPPNLSSPQPETETETETETDTQTETETDTEQTTKPDKKTDEDEDEECKRKCRNHILYSDYQLCSELDFSFWQYSSAKQAAQAHAPGAKVTTLKKSDEEKGECVKPGQHGKVYLNGEFTYRTVLSCWCCYLAGGPDGKEATIKERWALTRYSK